MIQKKEVLFESKRRKKELSKTKPLCWTQRTFLSFVALTLLTSLLFSRRQFDCIFLKEMTFSRHSWAWSADIYIVWSFSLFFPFLEATVFHVLIWICGYSHFYLCEIARRCDRNLKQGDSVQVCESAYMWNTGPKKKKTKKKRVSRKVSIPFFFFSALCHEWWQRNVSAAVSKLRRVFFSCVKKGEKEMTVQHLFERWVICVL